jgi:hypothetical protein
MVKESFNEIKFLPKFYAHSELQTKFLQKNNARVIRIKDIYGPSI